MQSSRREFLFGIGRLIVVFPAARALIACNTTNEGNGGPDGGGGGSCGNADQVSSSATAVTVTSSCALDHTHDFSLATSELSSPPARSTATCT